jgi:hypothetical protein
MFLRNVGNLLADYMASAEYLLKYILSFFNISPGMLCAITFFSALKQINR